MSEVKIQVTVMHFRNATHFFNRYIRIQTSVKCLLFVYVQNKLEARIEVTEVYVC